MLRKFLLTCFCVCSLQSVSAQQSIQLVDGISYTVKAKAANQNASVGEFVQYQATMKAGKLNVSSIFLGNKTLPMAKLKKDYPSLARMILVTPIGESRQWTLSADHIPPDIYRVSGPYRLDLKVIASPDLLKAPDNLNTPPANAVRTASGLRYIVLKRGKAATKPTLKSTVTVDYSGWDSRGVLFDSSIKRGEPTSFPLTGVIQGWQEAVSLMSPGDSYRFWIPGALAYDKDPNPSTPKGQLVFDITLHSFEN